MHAGGTDTFERFTERARQAVVLAQDEARALGHNYIGTEHLLLGLVREQEGLAARALDALGITLAAVREEVQRIVGVGDESATGQIPFTPRAKESLERALREALSLRHNYIGTEHILLGLVALDEGAALRVLATLDADADAVRTEVLRTLAGPVDRHEHAVDTFADVDGLVRAAEEWRREGWEIRSITVQRRRERAG
ncbi:MAG TPA: Clp protease N-terminal domain-containing protein [Gaiellaceae bacterium]|nr:Clp protease N-terminal domain-containing protein [Gaiellaceae bacterium]